MPDPISVKDERHCFVAVNDAFCRVVGCTREDDPRPGRFRSDPGGRGAPGVAERRGRAQGQRSGRLRARRHPAGRQALDAGAQVRHHAQRRQSRSALGVHGHHRAHGDGAGRARQRDPVPRLRRRRQRVRLGERSAGTLHLRFQPGAKRVGLHRAPSCSAAARRSSRRRAKPSGCANGSPAINNRTAPSATSSSASWPRTARSAGCSSTPWACSTRAAAYRPARCRSRHHRTQAAPKHASPSSPRATP